MEEELGGTSYPQTESWTSQPCPPSPTLCHGIPGNFLQGGDPQEQSVPSKCFRTALVSQLLEFTTCSPLIPTPTGKGFQASPQMPNGLRGEIKRMYQKLQL